MPCPHRLLEDQRETPRPLNGLQDLQEGPPTDCPPALQVHIARLSLMPSTQAANPKHTGITREVVLEELT